MMDCLPIPLHLRRPVAISPGKFACDSHCFIVSYVGQCRQANPCLFVRDSITRGVRAQVTTTLRVSAVIAFKLTSRLFLCARSPTSLPTWIPCACKRLWALHDHHSIPFKHGAYARASVSPLATPPTLLGPNIAVEAHRCPPPELPYWTDSKQELYDARASCNELAGSSSV